MAVVKQLPGISVPAVRKIPDEWDKGWFTNLIAQYLQNGDVRNATGVNGISISGTIGTNATIGLAAPVTIPAGSGSNLSLMVDGTSTQTDGYLGFTNVTTGHFIGGIGGGAVITGQGVNDLGIWCDAGTIWFATGNGTFSTLQVNNATSAQILTANNNGGSGGAFLSWRSSGTEVGFIGNGTSIGGANANDFGIGSDAGQLILHGFNGCLISGPNSGQNSLFITGSGGGGFPLKIQSDHAVGTWITFHDTNASPSDWDIGVGPGDAAKTFNIYDRTNGAVRMKFNGVTNGSVQFAGITTTASAANAFLDNTASNNLLRSTSSLRYKTNVQSIQPADINAVLQMRPVTFTSLSSNDDPTVQHLGFIAEEMALIDTRLVTYTAGVQNADGSPAMNAPKVPDSVQYDRITTLLVGAVQTLVQRVAALEQQLAAMPAPSAPTVPTGPAAPAAPLSLTGDYGLTGTNVVTTPSVITILT